MLAEEELVELTDGRGGLVPRRGRGAVGAAAVEQHELDHAFDADDVVPLFVVQVPALDDARERGRHVELAELDEQVVVAAQALH